MSDAENSVGTALAKTLQTVPEPVQTAFFAAAGRMLGSLASFPAAWFRRPVQGFEDVTDARSLVAKGLAQAVLDNAKNDPAIIQAATEAYLPSTVRKIANRASTLSIAAEEISESSPPPDQQHAVDEDWLNTFMRFSEDASSDRLQNLFGKILAGEIINPGSFSPATLRAVSELNQTIAADFSWAWSQNIETEITHKPAFERGEAWIRIRRLREAGLLSPQDAVIYQPDWNPLPNGLASWRIGSEKEFALIWMKKASKIKVRILNFSNIGIEMGKLLPIPDFRRNLIDLMINFPKDDVSEIFIISNSATERMWPAENITPA